MKKALITIAVIVLLLVGGMAVYNQPATCKLSTPSTVGLYAGPSTDSAVIAVLYDGIEAQSLARVGEWRYVSITESPDTRGWVNGWCK